MKQNDLLFLLISSAILVTVWVAFSIIHASLTSSISPIVGQELSPIAASFDAKMLTVLASRTKITPASVLLLSPSPKPTIVPVTPILPFVQVSIITPVASSSAQSGTQSATQGGTKQ
ncbi:MAG TPA: hypothetical protein VGT05_03330 [Patescibacteria group bacterium]|nr:hypothetical protein [Patescibacteria group bacterium]